MMLGTLVVTPSVRYTCGLRKSISSTSLSSSVFCACQKYSTLGRSSKICTGMSEDHDNLEFFLVKELVRHSGIFFTNLYLQNFR
jgi:hypothetical protein